MYMPSSFNYIDQLHLPCKNISKRMNDGMQERDKHWAKRRIPNKLIITKRNLFISFFSWSVTEQKHTLFSKPADYVVVAGDRQQFPWTLLFRSSIGMFILFHLIWKYNNILDIGFFNCGVKWICFKTLRYLFCRSTNDALISLLRSYL